MKLKSCFSAILLIGLLFVSEAASAQCPMCRASASTSLEAGSNNMRGINRGILYLFFAPYFLVGSLGYIWWRSEKAKKQAAAIQD